MIEIYLKTNTNFDKNGDITLNPTLCTYKDSESLLTLEHFIDEEGRWKYINFENVIAAEENNKKKLYRIYNVVRELYSVTAYARPIFYDLIDKVLLDVRPANKTGEEALNIILQDTGFKGHSNILAPNTAYYVRKNIVEAILGDEENSFINRWGGEFYCENFDVYVNEKIGSDNGVRVEFGYNLNEIEEDVNIEEVVTRIIPVGYNGIMLDGEALWVDSPLINKYTKPKMRVVEFFDVKVKERSEDEEGFNTIEEARAELVKQCKLLFENDIDKPTVNYKIDMINLANTTEYKDFKILVEVNKGDTVTCYIKHLDIDVKARVIDYERDLITGEYISIELGNVISNFFNEQADIQSKVNNILNKNGSVKAQTLEGTINAMQAQFKALKDIAQKQDVRAMLFEDRLEDSPTFGCMCIGTMGFEIASSFKPGTTEWDFRTFGTGKGFIADHIIAGILSAVLIRNLDASFEIDLSKAGGALFRNNGKDAIKIENNSIELYNWAKNGDYIGSLLSLVRHNDKEKALIGLVNDVDTAITIGFKNQEEESGDFKSYVEFDNYNSLNNLNPITFYLDVGIRQILNIGVENQHSLYNSKKDNLCMAHKNKILLVDKEKDKTYCSIGIDEFAFFDENGKATFWKNKGEDNFYIDGNLQISGAIKNFAGDVIAGGNNSGGNGGSGGTGGSGQDFYLNKMVSENGFVFIKQLEGYCSKPYDIGDGTRTIGYGTTEKFDNEHFIQLLPTCTEAQASEVFANSLKNYSTYVYNAMEECGKNMSEVKQHEFDAFCSFYYNHGNLKDREIFQLYCSGADKATIAEKWKTTIIMAGSAFEQGLRFRREKEANVFLNGDYSCKAIVDISTGTTITENDGKGHVPDMFKVPETNSKGEAIINSARKLIGKPYVFGGNYPPLGSSNGTDCSGLCQWAYNDNGISISRTTYTQIEEGVEVGENELQVGDLVFSNFSSLGVPEHVYLYSGKNANGELMCVEAPRTGLNIRERTFIWSNMRARRIL